MLHTVNKSPFEHSALEACLRYARQGSAVGIRSGSGRVAAVAGTGDDRCSSRSVVPDREDARDIGQDTLVALWKKRDLYDPSRPFVPWACRFAINEIRMLRRRNARWKWIQSESLIEELLARREELTEALYDQQERWRSCLK